MSDRGWVEVVRNVQAENLFQMGKEEAKKDRDAGLEVDIAVWTHAWSVAELDRSQEDRWAASA